MRRRVAFLALVTVLALVVNVLAAEVTVYLPNGQRITRQVKSLKEARFNSIVPQKYDVSCGAASLATLLKYYYGKDVTEEEIIKEMLELGDKEKIKREGFSLLEMKRYAEKRGYVAAGYKITADKLEKLKVPAITLLNVRGYAHFVVLKGVSEGKAFIADPAFGNKSMELADFDKAWNKVIFVVLSNSQNGRNEFTKDETVKAPKNEVRRILDIGTRNIFPNPNEF